jgi:hypothetical protein
MRIDEAGVITPARGPAAFTSAMAAPIYLTLVILNLDGLTGSDRGWTLLIAAATSVLLLTLAWLTHSGRVPDRHLEWILVGTISVVVVNCLVHIAVGGQLKPNTDVVAIALLAVGALVRPVRLFGALLLAISGGWLIVVIAQGLFGESTAQHDQVQLLTAVLAAAVLHWARRRSEQQVIGALAESAARLRELQATQKTLKESEAELAAIAALARCAEIGVDPRPVVLQSVRSLSGALNRRAWDAELFRLQATCRGSAVTVTCIPPRFSRTICRYLATSESSSTTRTVAGLSTKPPTRSW